MIEDILAKAGSGALLERQDALRLLEVATGSAEYYALLGAANAYARTAFRGRGVIFAQIGIDAQACGRQLQILQPCRRRAQGPASLHQNAGRDGGIGA